MYEKQVFHQTNPQTHMGRLHGRSESLQAHRKKHTTVRFAKRNDGEGIRGCEREAWYAMDDLARLKKGHHAGDAYF
jgi:hypothetical protein